MNPDLNYDDPSPVAEWDGELECTDCDAETEHLFIEWSHPGHSVTAECGACGGVREIEDNGR